MLVLHVSMQLIYDINITTIKIPSENNYQFEISLNPDLSFYETNNYTLIILTNISEIELTISSCLASITTNITSSKIFLQDNVIEKLQLNQCNSTPLEIQFVTQTQMNIQVHISLSVLLQELFDNSYQLFLENNVLTSFFSQTYSTYYIYSNQIIEALYFGVSNDNNQLIISSNKLVIPTSNNQLMYVEFQKRLIEQSVYIKLQQPKYNITLGDAQVVPIIQSNYCHSIIYMNISEQSQFVSLYVHLFNNNILYSILQNNERIYYLDQMRSFYGQNITIYANSRSLQNDILNGKQVNYDYMFVTLQHEICVLKQGVINERCKYYIVYLQHTDLESGSSDSSQPNGTIMAILQSTKMFYLSFSMNQNYVQNNKVIQHENQTLYYNIIEAEQFVQSVVQIKAARWQETMFMSIQHEIKFNLQQKVVINTNQNNFFYSRVNIIDRKDMYYVLRVTTDEQLPLSFYIGYGYYIPTPQKYDFFYKETILKSYEIVFSIEELISDTIHINILSNNSFDIQKNLILEFLSYQDNYVNLDKSAPMYLQSGLNFIIQIPNTNQYYISKNNVYYPTQALIYLKIQDQYCYQFIQLNTQITSVHDVYEITIPCIQNSQILKVNAVSHSIWQISNGTTIIGPIDTNNALYFQLPKVLNLIYYLKTNTTTSFIYYQGDTICDDILLDTCNTIEWNQYNISDEITNYTISILPLDSIQNLYYHVDVLMIHKLSNGKKFVFNQLHGQYLLYNISINPLNECTQSPVIKVNTISDGCIITSPNISLLSEFNSCSYNTSYEHILIDKPLITQDYVKYKTGYHIYIKILAEHGEIQIDNIQICDYNKVITITDCVTYNQLYIDIPSTITKQVLIATNVEIFYYVTNIQTKQIVEILDSFYSHTFLRGGNQYITQFLCQKDILLHDMLKIKFLSENIYQFNDSINVDVTPNDIYIINPKHNHVAIQVGGQGHHFQGSSNGIDFYDIFTNISLIFNNEERIFVKFQSSMKIQIVQLSNLYPLLRTNIIIIDYGNNMIVFPKVYSYLDYAYYKNSFVSSTQRYIFYINYNIYYNGTANEIELRENIFPTDVVRLDILVGENVLYQIKKIKFVQQEDNQYTNILAIYKKTKLCSFISLISMVLVLVIMIILCVIITIINVQLTHKIQQERHQVLQHLRGQAYSKKTSKASK